MQVLRKNYYRTLYKNKHKEKYKYLFLFHFIFVQIIKKEMELRTLTGLPNLGRLNKLQLVIIKI